MAKSQNSDSDDSFQKSNCSSCCNLSYKTRGVMTVVGAVILMLYLGCFFLWANISIYVLSYFHEFHPDSSYGFIFIVDSMLVLFNWCGYWIGVYLFQNLKWNPKFIILLGCGMALVGVYLSSYTKRLATYLPLYCLLNGLGCGMNYLVPLICGWEWFPERKGLVSGLTLGGYGFGSFIFSLISTKLVNPEGKSAEIEDPNNKDVKFFTPDVADRVPMMLRTLVYIWAGFVFVAVLLISRRPEK